MKKKILTVFLIIASCFTFNISAFAAEDSDTTGVKIYMDPSGSISSDDFIDSDVFEITYCLKDSSDFQTLKVKATECSESMKLFEIPNGSYTVLYIEYLGNNNDIIEAGYGCPNYFNIKDDIYIFNIAIGDSSLKTLAADYATPVIASDKEYIDWGYSTNDDNELENDTEDDYIESDSSTAVTHSSSGQDPIIEYYDESGNEEDEDSLGRQGLSILGRLAIFAVIGGVGLGIFYILHKRGKL